VGHIYNDIKFSDSTRKLVKNAGQPIIENYIGWNEAINNFNERDNQYHLLESQCWVKAYRRLSLQLK
jgi:hypothetical protein